MRDEKTRRGKSNLRHVINFGNPKRPLPLRNPGLLLRLRVDAKRVHKKVRAGDPSG